MTKGGLAMLLSDPAKRSSDDVAGVVGVMLARFESGWKSKLHNCQSLGFSVVETACMTWYRVESLSEG
jgi:hypothetical protein